MSVSICPIYDGDFFSDCCSVHMCLYTFIFFTSWVGFTEGHSLNLDIKCYAKSYAKSVVSADFTKLYTLSFGKVLGCHKVFSTSKVEISVNKI